MSEGNMEVGEMVVSASLHDWADNCVGYKAAALHFYSDQVMVMTSAV